MRETLTPYLIIYNETRTPLISTITLDGVPPVPPIGVFDYARAHGENRLTWQPAPSVRSAVVLVRYDAGNGATGFVLAGRSLREVEARITALTNRLLIGWLLTLAATFVPSLLLLPAEKSRNS